MNKHVISSKHSRRLFIKYSSVAFGASVVGGPYLVRGQNLNSKLNIASIGIGGKGDSDTRLCASENIVALCDVDQKILDARKQQYPLAKLYKDYRKMLDQQKDIDAVIVATPDHHHACASIQAMKLGKHVYCQKPLVHSVYEARMMRKVAAEHKVATQMGNQGSAENGLRRAVELIQAGVIGPVRQVHVWSNRPIWPQGIERPNRVDPVPEGLDWDLWLGPAPERPYVEKLYHTFAWRGWLDFGTGALGDMACHTANMPFRALKLGFPKTIEAESLQMNKETFPIKSKIRFEFPEREGMPPLSFWWYDGGNPRPGSGRGEHDGNNKPPKELTAEIEEMLGKMPGSGCLLVGDKGKLFSPDDYGARFFIKLNDEKEYADGNKHAAVKSVPETLPRNAHTGDSDRRQHLEWIAACKGGPTPYSNFDVAAYLTEIILLGVVALRVGKKLEWDGPNMKATNTAEAEQYVRRIYRKGWSI
jgi:hypothetical protein